MKTNINIKMNVKLNSGEVARLLTKEFKSFKSIQKLNSGPTMVRSINSAEKLNWETDWWIMLLE